MDITTGDPGGPAQTPPDRQPPQVQQLIGCIFQPAAGEPEVFKPVVRNVSIVSLAIPTETPALAAIARGAIDQLRCVRSGTQTTCAQG